MAASVRIGHIWATTGVTPNSTAHGRTAGGSGTVARIAEVSGFTGSSVAAIRIADITGASGSTNAKVRIAGITAATINATYVWTGSAWVPSTSVSAGGQGTGKGTSTGSGTVKFTGNVASKGTGKSLSQSSTGSTGSITFTGSGNLTLAGFKNPNPSVGSITLTGGGTLTLGGSSTVGPPGSGSITVVPDPLNTPPRVLLIFAGFLGATLNITRSTPAGVLPVRLGEPLTMTSGQGTLYDYEAPFGQPLTYTATPTVGPPITSDTFILDVRSPWLIHPSIPGLSTPIRVKQIGDKTSNTLAALNVVLGRRTSILETDGVRKAPQFDLTLRTTTREESQGLADVLDGADSLLVQIAYPFTDVTNYWYVGVGEVSSGAFSSAYGDPAKVWSLACTITDPPAGLQTSQRTITDLLNEEDTIQQMIADFATVRDVLIDNRLDGT
jgi:hypothetical protein